MKTVTTLFDDYLSAMRMAHNYNPVVITIFKDNAGLSWPGQTPCNELNAEQQQKLRIQENNYQSTTTETLTEYYNNCAGNAFCGLGRLFNSEKIAENKGIQQFFVTAFSNMLIGGNLFTHETGMYYALDHMKDSSPVFARQQTHIAQAVHMGVAFFEAGLDHFGFGNADQIKEELQQFWRKSEFNPAYRMSS